MPWQGVIHHHQTVFTTKPYGVETHCDVLQEVMGDSPPSEARSNCSTPSCNAPAWLGVFFVTHFISKRHDMPRPNHCSAWLVLAGQWQWNQRRMRRLSGWILASSSAKLSLQPRSKMSVEPGMTKRKKLDLQGFGHSSFSLQSRKGKHVPFGHL